MQTALNTTDQESLNTSFMNLKLLYRMLGIITIIYIAFMVLALIVAIAASATFS
jgi:hypothetical protein